MCRQILATLVLLVAAALANCSAPLPAAPTTGAPAPPGGAGAPAAAQPPVTMPPVAPAAGKPAAASVPRPPLSPRVVVRYGELGQASDAGFYIALDRGYFAEEGLDIETVSIGSGGRMVPGRGAG